MYRLYFKPDEVVVADKTMMRMRTCSQVMTKVMMQMGIITWETLFPLQSHRVTRGLNLPAHNLLYPRVNNLTGWLLCYKKHWI
jgi:hypothetical protein